MAALTLFVILLITPLAALAQAAGPSPPPPINPAAVAEASAPPAPVPSERTSPLRPPRVARRPVIDGRLDDEAWKSALRLKEFYQIQPGDNITPSMRTEVLLAYDADSLYIAFHAQDERDKVRATVAKRDSIFDDDYTGVFLDTFNDKRKAYVLFFNPLGVQADGILTEGVGEDYSLDIVMESKGVLTEGGYDIEVAIPFKSLRYEAGRGKLWGVNFYRRIKRFNNELNSWMPISRDKSGTLTQMGQLTGLEDLSTTRTLELIPSATFSETGRRVRALPASAAQDNPALLDAGRFVNAPVKNDWGLTGKMTLTPSMTLDFAVNPDFAQVEADQPVVTANQRFPIFFPEKRPFFLEGKEIFETPISAVHTRTIISPDYAAKLSGKRGRNTFGLLFASDSGPGSFSEDERNDPALLPAVEKFLGENATVGILRLKRDVGQESSIGFLATSYHFVEKHNLLGGFDGMFRLSPKEVLTFQVLGTTSRRFFFDPDSGADAYRTGNGLGYYVSYNHTSRNWFYLLEGFGRSRDYRADLGFTRRTNTNSGSAFFRYRSDPNPNAKLISWYVSNDAVLDFDWQGRSQSWHLRPKVGLTLPRNTSFSIGFGRGYERLFEEEFGRRRTPRQAGAFAGSDPERSASQTEFNVTAQTAPSQKYAAALSLSYGGGVFDLDSGAGPRFPRVSPVGIADPTATLDPGPGRSFNFYGSLTYQPVAALRASLDFTKSRLLRDDTRRTAFDDNIFTLHTTYQFTRFVFVRARLDYATLASSVRGQYLLGWTPNPGTALYIGYNDAHSYNGFNPFTGQHEPGFRPVDRTFFIKMSYLFRRGL